MPFAAIWLLLLFCSCRKEPIQPNAVTTSFRQFLIPQGQHFATGNAYKSVEIKEQKFTVKFDSSAIYQTSSADNQLDINKLYGFADNNQNHQQFSARFGWRWSANALRLFAYVYNNGSRDSKELGTVSIGEENNCSIKVTPTAYIFTLNNKVDSLPRLSTTANAVGYQLYPYFGGDETAPHAIRIWLREDN